MWGVKLTISRVKGRHAAHSATNCFFDVNLETRTKTWSRSVSEQRERKKDRGRERERERKRERESHTHTHTHTWTHSHTHTNKRMYSKRQAALCEIITYRHTRMLIFNIQLDLSTAFRIHVRILNNSGTFRLFRGGEIICS